MALESIVMSIVEFTVAVTIIKMVGGMNDEMDTDIMR